ncbi:methyl-accepting chemotaxis protein [Marinomonas algicola]|uniref:methyl-accepting chemotaxis protein n=1 Tax=Marinomonas algicola TaxID=2773454 RepID=UPI00174D437E|nr:methyl-accepting chemotaxis protein [Marinomonas algicola]
MGFFSNSSVRTKLITGFGIIILIMMVLVTLGIRNVNFIDRTLAEITDINSVKQRYAINYRGSVHDRAIAIRDVGIARSAQEIDLLEQEIRRLEDFYNAAEQDMNRLLQQGVAFSETEKDILKRIDNIKKRTLPMVEEVLQLSRRNEPVTAIMLDQIRPAFIQYLNVINEFIDYQEKQNQIATPKARAVTGGFENLMLILGSFSVVVSLIIALLIARSIRLSLGGEPIEAQTKIKEFSEGHLIIKEEDYIAGSVMDSLSAMGIKLTSIVRTIVSSSNNVAAQISDVANGNTQVLSRTVELSELTKMTAQRLESMRERIDQVAAVASKTEKNSETTAEYAKQGRDIVEKTATEIDKIATTVNTSVDQIRDLESRTQQIGGIIGEISSISEQTNLLALNAAIEAARAGESGRGFAVVADEVRNLAKRTGDATAQIDSVISEIQTSTQASVSMMEAALPQVENGRKQSEKATQLLQNIEVQAADSLSQVREVATASADQVSFVSDISISMDQIMNMTQESMDAMHNNAKAAENVDSLARSLKKEVEFFKL